VLSQGVYKLKSATKDGRFFIFAITDDRMTKHLRFMQRTACAGVHPRLALSSQQERIFGNVTNFAAEYARDTSGRHRAAQQIHQPACNLSLIKARPGCPAWLSRLLYFGPIIGNVSIFDIRR